jgi:hypothetical protein
MPETKAQINSLRAALSADVNRSFELKESFLLGSPFDQSRPSPMSHTSSEKQDQNKSAFWIPLRAGQLRSWPPETHLLLDCWKSFELRLHLSLPTSKFYGNVDAWFSGFLET